MTSTNLHFDILDFLHLNSTFDTRRKDDLHNPQSPTGRRDSRSHPTVESSRGVGSCPCLHAFDPTWGLIGVKSAIFFPSRDTIHIYTHICVCIYLLSLQQEGSLFPDWDLASIMAYLMMRYSSRAFAMPAINVLKATNIPHSRIQNKNCPAPHYSVVANIALLATR